MEHFCTDVSIATGAFAEYAVYKESCVYPLPDSLSMERGALLEPLSVVVHTIDLADIQPGRAVAISGGGTLGLMLVQLAIRAGAAKVLVSEPVAAKRELALRFGADVVVDPLTEDVVAAGRQLTDGRGFGTVIEASGNLRAAETALALAGNGATVVWAAVYPDEATVPVNPFHMYATEMTIRAVNVSPYSFPRAMELLPKLDLEPIVTDIHPLAELDEVLRTFREQPRIKTLIAP
jgi:(R,R)-butanediol dehydrogenase/meso-butanediol dehydrogenase/diacetyl reductase/L-iditol 2-dehydrogenase